MKHQKQEKIDNILYRSFYSFLNRAAEKLTNLPYVFREESAEFITQLHYKLIEKNDTL